MHGAFAYLVAIMAFVIVLNFVMLFMRLKRDRNKKPTKPAIEEEKAAISRHREIQRRLDREQEELTYHIQMQNKMFDMYELVRAKAADGGYEATDKEIKPESDLK